MFNSLVQLPAHTTNRPIQSRFSKTIFTALLLLVGCLTSFDTVAQQTDSDASTSSERATKHTQVEAHIDADEAINTEVNASTETGFFDSSLFKTVAVLTMAGFVFVLYRWRSNQLFAHNEELQKQVEKRTREIQEKTHELGEKNAELELVNWNLNNSILHAQQLADDAQAANKAKSQFLATMSHEIRTPLNGVIGMNTLLSISKLDDEQKNWNRVIDQCAKNLLSTIEDILDFSKIEAGILELDEKPFQLMECVGGILDYLSPKAYEKNIELLYYVDPKHSYEIIGDELRIRHIVTNLVGNAVKFTNEGFVKLEIGITKLPNNTETIFITVEDTGIGIGEKDQSRIFEPFTQTDSSLSRNYEGTGLGLAITMHFVKLMTGDINVESEPNQGSVFTVMLPLNQTKKNNPIFRRGDLPPINASLLGFTKYGKEVMSKTLASIEVVHSNADSLDDFPPSSAFQMSRFCFVDWDNFKGRESLDSESQEFKDILRNWHFIILASYLPDLPSNLSSLDSSVTIMEKPAQVRRILANLKSSAALEQKGDDVSNSWIAEHKSRFAASPLKILIAEDNEMNGAVTINALKVLGYSASLAINGKEALNMATETNFDLILLDLHMPHVDGIEVAKQINRRPKETGSPMLVALTAAVSEDDRKACSEVGMTHFLPKPLDFRKLVEVLEDVHANLST